MVDKLKSERRRVAKMLHLSRHPSTHKNLAREAKRLARKLMRKRGWNEDEFVRGDFSDSVVCQFKVGGNIMAIQSLMLVCQSAFPGLKSLIVGTSLENDYLLTFTAKNTAIPEAAKNLFTMLKTDLEDALAKRLPPATPSIASRLYRQKDFDGGSFIAGAELGLVSNVKAILDNRAKLEAESREGAAKRRLHASRHNPLALALIEKNIDRKSRLEQPANELLPESPPQSVESPQWDAEPEKEMNNDSFIDGMLWGAIKKIVL